MLQSNMESTPFCAGAAPFLPSDMAKGLRALGGRMKGTNWNGARIAPDAAPEYLWVQSYQLPVLAMLAHGSCGGRWPS